MAERIIHLHKNSKDISGHKFSRLTAMYPVRVKAHSVHWVCVCDCGGQAVVSTGNLSSGGVKSCGCYLADRVRETTTSTHGMHNTREYKSWQSMKTRCTNDKAPNFHLYGGRGITACDRWSTSFEAFYEDMGDRPKGCSLDRIDTSKGYFKENCKWSTPIEQSRNRRNTPMITFRGETRCLAEWAEHLNINYQTLQSRIIRYGWAVDRAFTE